jgi:hypothetical protein
MGPIFDLRGSTYRELGVLFITNNLHVLPKRELKLYTTELGWSVTQIESDIRRGRDKTLSGSLHW